MGVDIELQRGRIICNLANRTVVIGLALEADVAFGDEGVALFFIPRIPCLRAGERLIALVVVKDEDSLAVCDEFLRIFLIDRDIFFAAIGIAGVVGLIRVCRDVVLIHAAEQRVIEHIFGAHRVEAGCGEGVVVLDGAEVYLHTRGLVLGAEEVEGDAEVEKTLALLVEEGGSDGDVVRRRIDVNADGDVGQHLFEGRRRVGCDKTHDELEEARARLQGYLAGEHVEQHRRLVGVPDVGVPAAFVRRAVFVRRGDRFGRSAEVAEVDLVVQEGLQRIVGEVDLELRARAEDPAEVCIQRRAVDDVVCVVVVTDVPHVAHIVESEHVREGVVRRFGAPDVDGKLQTRDVEGVVIRLVSVVDLDRRADLEGQHRLIAVGYGEERVHVAEDRPQHLVHGRAAVRIGVVLGETLVRAVVLIELDILPSHEDVLRLGQLAEHFLVPLLRGVVGHVLTEGDGAADGEVDGIQLAGVAVLDVLAVVVDDLLAVLVLVVVCRKPRLECAGLVHAAALDKDRFCIRHGGEPARRGAVHEGEVVALVDGAVVVDGLVRRQVAESVDVVVGCVVAVHIGVGRRVEVGMELGHADEGCGPLAHVLDVALTHIIALTHIGVGVAVVVPCIDVRRRHGHVGREALRLHLDAQVVLIGLCDESIPIHAVRAVRVAQIFRGDGVVLAAVVEVDLTLLGGVAYDCGHVDELLVHDIVAALLLGVGVVLCRRLGHVDAEGEAVTPQPHARLDEGLGVLGRIHHPDVLEVNAAVHRAQHGMTVHGFIVFDIEDEGARERGIAELRRRRAVEPFRLHPVGVGRLGREDVVAVHVEVGLDGRDVPIAELVNIVCRLFRVGHIVAQTQIALAREGVGVDIVHAVRVVALDGEAGVREVDLLERRPEDGVDGVIGVVSPCTAVVLCFVADVKLRLAVRSRRLAVVTRRVEDEETFNGCGGAAERSEDVEFVACCDHVVVVCLNISVDGQVADRDRGFRIKRRVFGRGIPLAHRDVGIGDSVIEVRAALRSHGVGVIHPDSVHEFCRIACVEGELFRRLRAFGRIELRRRRLAVVPRRVEDKEPFFGRGDSVSRKLYEDEVRFVFDKFFVASAFRAFRTFRNVCVLGKLCSARRRSRITIRICGRVAADEEVIVLFRVVVVDLVGLVGIGSIRPLFQRRVEVVVDVDVDAQIRLVELVVKRASVGRQQNVEQLFEVIRLDEDPDVGGRDAHAVDERLDVRRDLLREQRQLDVDAAAQQFAEVDGQREPAFVRRAVFVRRGDRFGRSAEVAEVYFFAHHAADERHQLGEVHVDAGLTEVAEIDVQTCVGTHSVTVRVGIEEGGVTRVFAVLLFVVTLDGGGEHIAVLRAVGVVILDAHIAVFAVLGREVVGVAVLTLVVGILVVILVVIRLAFVAAQRQVDSEHGMLRHTVVGDGGELHGRVDEVEEVLKTDEVVHIRIFVVDVAVRIGHLLGADEAADDIDEGDEVDVAGEASESHSRAVLVIAQVVGRRKAAQIVEERAQLELEGHGEIESAQDLGRGVAARHRGEHRVELEAAVREEIFKQRGEVDVVDVQRREEQLERDGLAQRHGVEAVEVVEGLEIVAIHRELALFGEEEVDVVHAHVEVEHGVVVVGIGVRTAHVSVNGQVVVCRHGLVIELLARGVAVHHRDVGILCLVVVVLAIRSLVVGVVSPAVVLALHGFVTDVEGELARVDLGVARLAEGALFLVKDEETFLALFLALSLGEDVESVGVGIDLDIFVQFITVAFEAQLRTEGNVDAVGDVDGDVHVALQFLIHQVVERHVADGDDRQQPTHDPVAEDHGQLALADEQGRHFVLEAHVRGFARIRVRGVVGGDRLGSAGAYLHVVVDGGVEQVGEQVFDERRDLGHGHGKPRQTEEGQIEIDHVVHVVCRQPTHLRAALGREVVKLDLDLGAGQVEHIQHQREVQTQMRRGVALAGVRDLDDHAFEVAEDAREDLTDVHLALRDGKLELHGRAHRDDGVVEREQRYIVVVLFTHLRLFHLGVDAVGVGVGFFLRAVVSGRSLGLARGDVVGDDGIRPAELELYAADGKICVHGAHFRTEDEIELVKVGVGVVNAQQPAVRIPDIAVAAVVGVHLAGRAVTLYRVIGAASDDVDVLVDHRLALAYLGKVGDADVVAAFRLIIEGVSVTVEDDGRVAREPDIGARAVRVEGVLRRFVEVVSGLRLDILAVRRQDVIGAVNRVGIRYLDVALFSLLVKIRVMDVDVVVLAYLRAEGDFEAVEDVRKAAEVGHESRQQSADDALGDDDLHRGVGVDDLHDGVAHLIVAFRRRESLCARRRNRRIRLRDHIERQVVAIVASAVALAFVVLVNELFAMAVRIVAAAVVADAIFVRIGVISAIAVDGLRAAAVVAFAVRVVIREIPAAALGHVHRLDDEGEEVGYIGIVVDDVEHARAVEIEVALGQIDARQHVIGDVARLVAVQQLQRRFDGGEVGFLKESIQLLIVVELAVGERAESDIAEVRRHGQTERDAVLKGVFGVDLEDEILDVLLQQGADVIAALALGRELRLAGDGQRDLLGSEPVGRVPFFSAVDEPDDGVHQLRHVEVRLHLARGHHGVVGGGDIYADARVHRHREIEARVGGGGHREFDAVAAAHVEADLAFVAVQDEVLKDVVFLRARDERHHRAEHVGGQHDVYAEAVLEDVAVPLKRCVEVGAQHDGSDERVEHAAHHVGGIEFAAARIVALAVCVVVVALVRLHGGCRHGFAFRAPVRGTRIEGIAVEFYLLKQPEEVRTDLGTAEAGEVDVEIAVDEIERDVSTCGAVLGVEDYLDAQIERFEDGDLRRVILQVQPILIEALQEFADLQRLEVEDARDVDVKAVADGIVDVELDAQRRDEHIHEVLQRRGLTGQRTVKRVFERGHLEERVHDVGQALALAHVGAVVVLHEGAVGQLRISVRKRIGVDLVAFDLGVISVCGVLDGQRDVKARLAARGVALEVAARDDAVDVVGQRVAARLLVEDVGDEDVGHGKFERRVIGVGGHDDGGILEVDVHIGYGAEVERSEDARDVNFAAHCAEKTQQHRFGDVQRDVSAAQFHDDLEGVEGFFFRVPCRGGRLGGRRCIFLSLKQILHRLQHHCDDAGLFKDEVVLGNDAHVDVERLAAQICAEDERVSDAVLDLDGKLRLLLGVKVNVALDRDLHAEGNVLLDLETEIECEIPDERREHIAHGQLTVGQTVGALELEIEAYRRGQRDGAVFGKDALKFIEVHALGHDGGIRIVDVDSRLDAEEGEPYHCGIGSQCEIYADISLVAFALAVEQAEIAVVGIELDEVFCVELIPAGQQCAQKRADEVRAETDLELLIRHHYAADDGKDCVEDARHCLAALIALAVVVIVGTSMLFRGIRRNERGCLGRSFGSGCGGIWGRLFFTACEQLRDVDAGHRDLAAYDALRVGSDVKGAGAVPAGDDVDREQVSARACDLESDVGHPEDVEHESRGVGNVKLFGQTDERTQREVELRGHVVVQRECDDQPLDERLHVFFYGVAAAREVVYPRAHFPLVGAAVFYRAEGNGAGDLRIDVVKSKFGGVQRGFAVCALGESELAYVAEVVEVDVGRYDGRHVFVINALADADGQRRQRDHDVRKVADGRLRREQVAVGIGEVAPIERERRADLTYVIDADGARDGLGGGLCKLYHYTLGRDVKQQIELGLSILWRNAFVPPCRGDRGSARFGHGLFAFVALAVVVGVDVFVLEKIRDDAHEVDLDTYACAYERGRVNIEYTLAIVCRKQHFGIAVRQIVDDAHGKFGPVRPFGSVGAHQLGEYGAEVELARHGERDVYAHALGEEDLAHAFTEGYAALVQVALDAESETDVDVRLIKEVDKFDFLGDFYVALTVDDGVDAAEGETEVEVFAEADRGADGQTFGGVAARDVQAVGKRDAHADVKSEILARSIRDGDAFKIQKTQHLREHDAAYGDVHIEVAQRKLGVIRRKQREKDAHDVDAVAVRFRNGDGVTCRPRLSEEGLYVDHEGKTAEFLGSRKMQDTVHQPRAQRCRTRVGALFGELDVDVEHGQQARERRAYICAFGQTVYDPD